jgi:hypothetical protein
MVLVTVEDTLDKFPLWRADLALLNPFHENALKFLPGRPPHFGPPWRSGRHAGCQTGFEYMKVGKRAGHCTELGSRN